MAELGFALVRGVPAESGRVEDVVRTFGAIRETNYGRIFDVSVSVDATNLADTARPLSAHTDNPYRDPAPTLQLLHCLETAVDGGNTILVDGFAAVDRLGDDAVARLARTPIRFAYRDASADLQADVPVVSLGVEGEVVGLHLNNRSKGIPVGDASEVGAWYAAYLALLDAVRSPELELAIRLEPGDVLVFDNARVLHGRTGFESTGARRLQGCYADRDALLSALAVLERERRVTAVVDEIFARFQETGGAMYIGEPVTVSEHMLQTAALAADDDAAPELVAAALLHDYGHLVHDLPEDSAEHGIDTRHEEVGVDLLARWFPPAVTEPIRLHVAAKRYLVAVDPRYRDALSPASIVSLELQGGAMSEAEVAEFEALPHAVAACRLRRYDDAGKDPDADVPPLESYRDVLTALVAAGGR